MSGSPARFGSHQPTRIYLHIGTHKTGTTTFQHLLSRHHKSLGSIGYRAYVNPPQMNARSDRSFEPAWIAQQLVTARREGISSLIFSMESMSAFSQPQLESVVRAFSGHETTIVLCVRHWATFLPSRWTQSGLRRDTQSFPAYLQQLKLDQDHHLHARFDLIVDNALKSAPSDLRVVSYDNALKQAGLVATLLGACDLPTGFVERYGRPSTRRSTRIDTGWIDVVRLFNGAYAAQHGLTRDALYHAAGSTTPVDEFFDCSRASRRFLMVHPTTKRQVIDELNRRKVSVRLDATDPTFQRWEALLEAAARDHLVNSIDGAMFRGVATTDFSGSTTEIEDLDSDLRSTLCRAVARSKK